MAGIKGMRHTNYPLEYKAEVVRQINSGEITLCGFCRNSGIDRSEVKRWKRESRDGVPPRRNLGRPRTKPLTTHEELIAKIKELQMQVDFYQFFLKAAGSKPDRD